MFSKLNQNANRQKSSQSARKITASLPIPLIVKITALGTVGLLVGLMLILIGILQAGDRLFESINNLFSIEQPEPEVDITSLVVQRIQGASELTTAIFTMEAVVPASQDRKLGNLTLGQTKLLYIAQGEVRAGIDLKEINSSNVTVGETSIQVTLPPPQILDTKIDVERSQVYDYDRGFLSLGPDTAPQLQVFAQQETLKKIKAAACDKGLLSQANERAKTALTNLLSVSGYQTVLISTSSPDPQICQ